MQNYFLQFPKLSSSFTIDHQSPTLSIGSCFAEEVGYNLHTNCFNININPFGIVFSPKVMVKQLYQIIEKGVYSDSDIVHHEDLYFSFDHHSSFSGVDRYQVLTEINTEISDAHHLLKKKNAVLMLTFGSAFYYELKETEEAVSNCHKQANHLFHKKMQTSDEMIQEWKALMTDLLLFNPTLKIIFTVSPVRYVRDGVIENNVSKAQLFSLAHHLGNHFNACSNYFPAYEMVNDCLRDYRFFKEDLVHPNKIAVQEVWHYFQSVFLSEPTRKMVLQIEEFNKQIRHSIRHNETKAARLFDEKSRQSRQSFFSTFPYLQNSKYFTEYFSVYID
jgi:hypothetical protein